MAFSFGTTGGTASMFPSQNFGQQSSSGFGSNMMAGARKASGMGGNPNAAGWGMGARRNPGSFSGGGTGIFAGNGTPPPAGYDPNNKGWQKMPGGGYYSNQPFTPPPGWTPKPDNMGSGPIDWTKIMGGDQGGAQPGDTRQGSSIMRNGQVVGHYGNKNEAIYNQGQSQQGGGGFPNVRPDGSYDSGGPDQGSARREGDWLVTTAGMDGSQSRRNTKTGQYQYQDRKTGQWIDAPGPFGMGGGGVPPGWQSSDNGPALTPEQRQQQGLPPLRNAVRGGPSPYMPMNPQGMTRAPQSMLPSNPNAAFAGGEPRGIPFGGNMMQGGYGGGMVGGGGNIYNSLPPYATQIMQQSQARMNNPNIGYDMGPNAWGQNNEFNRSKYGQMSFR